MSPATCAELDERVGAFLERPFEGDWPYLWLGATYVRSRQGGRVVSVAVVVTVAVNRAMPRPPVWSGR